MTQETQKKRKLSKKQIGFVDDYVIDGNGTKAALNNYDIEGKDPEKIASVIATQNLGKVSVQEAIEIKQSSLKSALEKQGITPEKIARKVDQLLESNEYQAVDKGIAHATKIYGVVDETEKPQGNNYTFIFSKEVQANVREIEARIKQQLIKHVEPIETRVEAKQSA